MNNKITTTVNISGAIANNSAQGFNKARDTERANIQGLTYADMVNDLALYGKTILIRPTGFGKTYMCAQMCNFNNKEIEKLKAGHNMYTDTLSDRYNKLTSISKRAVVFVYTSEILRQTFQENNRIQYADTVDIAKDMRSEVSIKINGIEYKADDIVYTDAFGNITDLAYYDKNRKIVPSFDIKSTKGKLVLHDRIIYTTYTALGMINKGQGTKLSAEDSKDADYVKSLLNNQLNRSLKDKNITASEKIKRLPIGLVIFDEAQRMGAYNADKVLCGESIDDNEDSDNDDEDDEDGNTNEGACTGFISSLVNKGIPYIGATATPVRNFGPEVVSKYFSHVNSQNMIDDVCIGQHMYTLGDAIENKLIMMPVYASIPGTTDDITNYLRTLFEHRKNLNAVEVDKAKQKLETTLNKKAEKSALRSTKIIGSMLKKLTSIDTKKELEDCIHDFSGDDNAVLTDSNIQQLLPTIGDLYKHVLSEVYTGMFKNGQGGVLKFIVFDSRIDSLTATLNEQAAYFTKAFEKIKDRVEIRCIEIYSKSCDHKDVSAINGLDTQCKKFANAAKGNIAIELIGSINMLNVGYHIDNISGVILNRWTSSNQIYFQQVGRCMSTTSNITPIIFDLVNCASKDGVILPLYTEHLNNSNTYETVTEDGKTLVETRNNKITLEASEKLKNVNKVNTMSLKDCASFGRVINNMNKMLQRIQKYYSADEKNVFNDTIDFYEIVNSACIFGSQAHYADSVAISAEQKAELSEFVTTLIKLNASNQSKGITGISGIDDLNGITLLGAFTYILDKKLASKYKTWNSNMDAEFKRRVFNNYNSLIQYTIDCMATTATSKSQKTLFINFKSIVDMFVGNVGKDEVVTATCCEWNVINTIYNALNDRGINPPSLVFVDLQKAMNKHNNKHIILEAKDKDTVTKVINILADRGWWVSGYNSLITYK